MPRVFVSYSRADLIHVLSVVSALRRAGLETWIDIDNLKPGERWRNAIEAALADADAMIFCLSPLSVESAWTSIELKFALDRGVAIVPLMIQRVRLELLPASVRERQILDMEMWPADSASIHAARAILTAIGAEELLPVDGQPCETGGFRTIWVSLGQWAPAEQEVLRLSPPEADAGYVRHWRVKAVSAPILADILAQTKHAARAIITVDEHADPRAANIVIGAVAARLGEWRVTVVENADRLLFKKSAELSRARYVAHAGGRCAGEAATAPLSIRS
jgi:hypothetical protein